MTMVVGDRRVALRPIAIQIRNPSGRSTSIGGLGAVKSTNSDHVVTLLTLRSFALSSKHSLSLFVGLPAYKNFLCGVIRSYYFYFSIRQIYIINLMNEDNIIHCQSGVTIFLSWILTIGESGFLIKRFKQKSRIKSAYGQLLGSYYSIYIDFLKRQSSSSISIINH